MQGMAYQKQQKYDGNFKRCLALFELLRGKVTVEEERRYREVLAECLEQTALELPETPLVGV